MEREEYIKIYNNGLAHIKSAKLLAENSEFGFASSHLVLGIEELIKYQVVLVNTADNTVFQDNETNPKNRNSIFRDHKTKHTLIKEFQEAISKDFPDIHVEYVFYKMTGQELKEEHKKIEKNRFKEIGSFLSVAYTEINIPDTERQTFFQWLENANDLKNNGFYVNLTESGIESPKDIEKNIYETALKYTTAILEQTSVIRELDITEDEFINMLNSSAPSDTENTKSIL